MLLKHTWTTTSRANVYLNFSQFYAQVNEDWPASLQWDAFRALTVIVEASHRALDASLTGQCIQMTITLLKVKPHDRANTHALQFLARLFRWSPSSSLWQLAQAFVGAGGPQTLVHFLRSEPDHRNMALMAVLVATKCFSYCIGQTCHLDEESLANVRSQLERHATTDLPTLCEECCPNADDSRLSVLELQESFEAAFHRLPTWAVQEVCTILSP
jgi:hypothetical protein